MLRRTKADLVNKLPDKIEINISCSLSPIQQTMYQDFLTLMGVDEKYGSDKGKKNLLMQLRKLCLHPYLFDGVEDTSLP